MERQQKYRIKQVFLLSLLILGLGLLLLLSIRFLHRGIPCPFFALTKLRCPFCGMTRAVLALLSGNLHEAMRCNLMVFPYLTILLALGLIQARRFIITGSCFFLSWEKKLCVSCIIFSLVWMAVRNIFYL